MAALSATSAVDSSCAMAPTGSAPDDFEVRPIAEADLPAAQDMFLHCDVAAQYGAETGRDAVRVAAEGYIRYVASEGDLSSYDALSRVFKSPGSEFWVAVHVPTGAIAGFIGLECKHELAPAGRVAELRRM